VLLLACLLHMEQAMGQLLLQLACAVGSLPSASLDFASMHYSHEFVRLLVLLLGVAEGGGFSWRAVSALLGERLLLETDTLATFNEQLVGVPERMYQRGCTREDVPERMYHRASGRRGPGAPQDEVLLGQPALSSSSRIRVSRRDWHHVYSVH
jgi:hypothetical protein